MNNTFKIAALGLALAGLGTSARADLTFQGAVGLPNNPTAQVPQQNGARVQLNYNEVGDSDGDGDLYGLAGAMRVGNSPFEINGAIHYLNAEAFGADDDSVGFSVGGKYLITRESDPAGVRLAAGAGYTKLNPFDTDLENIYGYVVGTKYLSQAIEGRVPITGHLGLRYDHFEADGEDDSKLSIYAGVEVPITRNGEFQFVGEIGTEQVEDGDTPFSAALRFRRDNQPFGATIGVSRTAFGDSGLFAQLGYTFDTK